MKTDKIKAVAAYLDEAKKHQWDSETLATAILAKVDSLDLQDLALAPQSETGPLATVRRIAHRVQLGDTGNAIKLLSLYGGLVANERITALLSEQAEEIKRLRAKEDAK